ncbi:LysR family transcriptional regulator [Vibrio cholerae]|uniref:LysR family transcriptional regulator n=1 Tax=Vibrio cholerae TaxID=666 RepID=UPI00021A9714|nr:LysR family transcriptional regulator [Vibrio cholerae]EGR1449759.1 LysR family transcriptional regulator [Vibrio cholerae]EGS74295.1 bacterial regulatory helix-turn-helix, lysR family protein [Vibrio cholerae BJG-01]EHY8703344.1 LysR family transcriptional regulator [Vibrio cholerae]EJL6472612.1 LysR family transcriptional regulator [Vibrio cholerae]EJL6928715.1 LysR family transcriptional regulator [Vibrio cholerae]
MDWLQSAKTYIKVVEEGSFNGAARKLNTTSSAVSKRIHWLEERIGVQLLKRTTRSVTQTEAGALFYQRAKAQLESWQSVVDETRSVNQTPAGLLRIGATLAVGSKFLMQYLDEFLQRYPDIRVQLITTTPGQLPELHLDLFISREIEQLNSLSFKATPLFEYQAAFYASPSYLAKYGVPQTLQELTEHNVLCWGEQTFREVKTAQGKRLTLTGNFATTNPEALFYAGKAGMGIIVTGHIMIKEELKQGNLVRLLPDVTIDQATVYAYYPKLEYQHTRTQLFLDHLKQKLVQNKTE